MPCYSDSDESDSDEMLPLGAFRPTPEEEEWTIVGKSHDVPRYAKDIDHDRLYVTHDKLDHSGMCCKQLDYIDGNVNRYDSELPTDFVENPRPTIQRVSVEVVEEASTDGATNEQ